jgi:hypothetical protein
MYTGRPLDEGCGISEQIYTNVYINFPFICSNIPAAPAFSAVRVARFFVFCVNNVQGAWYSLNMVRFSVLSVINMIFN